ncbi:hypothetical protein Mapa_003719 [Marchantia paleacea]|nr:hypothetical protein Mapa_003719 [Marchantia paleacea]
MAALYQRNFDHRFFNPPLRQGFRRRYLHSGFGEQVESPKFTFPQTGTRKDDLDIHDNRVCVTKQIDKFKPDHCSPGPAIFLHNGSMGDQEKSEKTNPVYCRFGKEPRFREIKQTPGPGHYDY